MGGWLRCRWWNQISAFLGESGLEQSKTSWLDSSLDNQLVLQGSKQIQLPFPKLVPEKHNRNDPAFQVFGKVLNENEISR